MRRHAHPVRTLPAPRRGARLAGARPGVRRAGRARPPRLRRDLGAVPRGAGRRRGPGGLDRRAALERRPRRRVRRLVLGRHRVGHGGRAPGRGPRGRVPRSLDVARRHQVRRRRDPPARGARVLVARARRLPHEPRRARGARVRRTTGPPAAPPRRRRPPGDGRAPAVVAPDRGGRAGRADGGGDHAGGARRADLRDTARGRLARPAAAGDAREPRRRRIRGARRPRASPRRPVGARPRRQRLGARRRPRPRRRHRHPVGPDPRRLDPRRPRRLPASPARPGPRARVRLGGP
ncbi:hypothetical protein QFZ62_000457 [Clavibacter sp. B3I6]|nr:hypothetical protein [Clavibacter sp. B3I6]